MNRKNRILSIIMALCLIVTSFVVTGIEPCYATATSYTNAKEFYQSIPRDQKVSVYNGCFYFATCAGSGASWTTLLFSSIGFDFTMTGNGVTVQFSVEQRREETGNSGSLAEVPDSEVEDLGYTYNLYCVETEDLYRLAKAAASKQGVDFDKLVSADTIEVYAWGVMTTRYRGTSTNYVKYYGDYQGYVEEDGNTSSGGYLYKNGSHLLLVFYMQEIQVAFLCKFIDIFLRSANILL